MHARRVTATQVKYIDDERSHASQNTTMSLLRMDSGPLFDVVGMRTDAHSSYGHYQGPDYWPSPGFTFGGQPHMIADTFDFLRELDSGESSPLTPNEAPAGPCQRQVSTMEFEAPPKDIQRPRSRRKSNSEAERVERRRARNRAAQARFRQKQRVR